MRFSWLLSAAYFRVRPRPGQAALTPVQLSQGGNAANLLVASGAFNFATCCGAWYLILGPSSRRRRTLTSQSTSSAQRACRSRCRSAIYRASSPGRTRARRADALVLYAVQSGKRFAQVVQSPTGQVSELLCIVILGLCRATRRRQRDGRVGDREHDHAQHHHRRVRTEERGLLLREIAEEAILELGAAIGASNAERSAAQQASERT